MGASVAVDYEKIGTQIESVLAKELTFLVGVSRWGTDWIGQSLTAHPDVSGIGEGHFTDDLFPNLADLFTAYNRKSGDGKPTDGFMPDDIDFMLRTAAGLLFIRSGRGADSKHLIETTPEHILHLDVLGRVFPNARFIHVLRDGRDEAAAAWTYNLVHSRGGFRRTYANLAAFAEVFAGNWIRGVGAARQFGRSAGDRFLEIRAESIVAAPGQTAAGVFKFIGVESDADMIRACADTAWDLAPLDVEPGDWKTKLDADSQRAFARQAGELLKLIGYAT